MQKSISKKTSPDVLIKTAHQLKAIFESLTDGITVEDKTGKVVYANDAAARVFGLNDSAEIIGKKVTRLFNKYCLHDRKGKEISLDHLPAIRALKTKKDVIKVMKLTDKITDEERWFMVKATIAHPNDGDPVLAVKLFQDITEGIEEQKRREIFVSLVSHEIKNPLTSIKAFSQLLKRRVVTGGTKQAVEFVENIDGQVDKITKIINDLLDISRIRRGLLKIDLKPVEIDELVDGIIENFTPTAPESRITRRGRANMRVHADEIRVGQVIINLLTNAKKYSPSGTKITVRLKKQKDAVVISVTDEGVGIPQKQIKNLFRLYSRLENDNLQSRPGGLGLGLYISSAIVKSHKGKIWVESEEGKGSTFYFSLPIHPPKNHKD